MEQHHTGMTLLHFSVKIYLMPLPMAVSTLLDNARHQIIVSQALSGIVGVLLGPGCLVLSFLPVDALPEYRLGLTIGGIIISLLLTGLVFETRRKLAGVDRIIQAFDQNPDSIGRIVTGKDQSSYSASYKVRVELKDGTTQTLPIAEQDYNALLNYLRAKYPGILKERAAKTA
jgi:hypothetical protein